MTWHATRFIENPRKVAVHCRQCGRPMWLPPSKVEEYPGCSAECSAAWREAQREARRRDCETCGKSFIPRQVQITNGGGRFCSQKCNAARLVALNSPQAVENRLAGIRLAFAEGRYVRLRGEANPRWRGGTEARLQRYREAGTDRAWCRAYRAANPDKVREFAQRRGSRKVGRLPRGTVNRIGGAQRWRCAICACSIKKGYHVDHIMPLARGGEHVPRNIQLLCQTCNVRKNAKDPIDYMQSLGRLL